MFKKIWKKLGDYFGNTIVNKIPSRTIRKIWYKIFGAKIGKKTVIYRKTEILKISGLKVGNRTQVGWYCLLDSRGGLEIGNDVVIASYVKVVSGTHDINSVDFEGMVKKIVIKDMAWICTGALILPGISIGRGAVVAAGAVVTKDVPDFCVVAGNPAKVIKMRNTEINYNLPKAPILS